METNKKGETKPEYVPGVCNIGHAERRARRMSGWIGLGMTIALWVILIAVRTSQIVFLYSCLPVWPLRDFSSRLSISARVSV